MIGRFFVIGSLTIFTVQIITSVTYAESARVLPKGVSRGRVISTNWLTYDKRYDENGDIEDIGNNYSAPLDSNVFPNLRLVEAAFGMPSGSANIGTSDVHFDISLSIDNYVLEHGITDKLTGAINIPYWRAKNDVRAHVDGKNATVGKSAVGAGFGAPLVPLAGGGPFGDATPLNTEDVQQLLGTGLDVNGDGIVDVPGFGYRRFRTSWDEGLGDIETYLKYKYLDTENWRLSITGGIRFPTGQIDDPDNLTDVYSFTSGAYAILGRLSNDFKGIKNHVLNATIKYDLRLSDTQEKRILSDPNIPLTIDKEKVKIDYGDILAIDVSESYTPFKGLSFSLAYVFTTHKKDRVSGDNGHLRDPVTGGTRFNYDAYVKETDARSHEIKVGLSYDTVQLYKEKKFAIPMNVELLYRNRVDGKNNYSRSHYLQFGIGIFF